MRFPGALLLLAACGGGVSHHHGAPLASDPNKLYVELATDDDALRTGADVGLGKIGFVVPVDSRGEIELEGHVTLLDQSGADTVCKVQILVLRLPKDSLLGSAEGAARAGKGHGTDCIEQLTERLVRGKVRNFLRRLQSDKRKSRW